MTNDLKKLTKEIIENNQYLALSTVGNDGKPWTCILAYSYDEDYNFYFVSLPTSKHSLNSESTKNVSFSIYNSTQGFGLGVGLQIEGIVNKVEKENVEEVENIYFSRKYPYGDLSNDFTDSLRKLIVQGTYNFYKLTPIHVWINNSNSDKDERVEINL